MNDGVLSFRYAYSSPSSSTSAFGALREDVAELWIVLVFVDMVDANVSAVGP